MLASVSRVGDDGMTMREKIAAALWGADRDAADFIEAAIGAAREGA